MEQRYMYSEKFMIDHSEHSMCKMLFIFYTCHKEWFNLQKQRTISVY